MYAKTEISYIMRDKIIPCLLNSERTIKFEDIKEVLEKTSFWKNRDLSNVKNSKSSSIKSKTLLNKMKNKNKIQYIKSKKTILSTDRDNMSRESLLSDILKINTHPNKSRNYKRGNIDKTQSNEPCKTISTQKTEINFCNPILRSFSNQIYKLTDTLKDKNIPFKINKSKFEKIQMKDKNIKYKNTNIFFRNKNNLKTLKSDYDYKIFYYLKKNEIKKYNREKDKIQIDEINNHLILRGLAINDEQKKIYTKCQFTNLAMDENKKSLNNLKEFSNIKNINNKDKIKKYTKYSLNNNYKFNISYSLKSLLKSECPINIKLNLKKLVVK